MICIFTLLFCTLYFYMFIVRHIHCSLRITKKKIQKKYKNSYRFNSLVPLYHVTFSNTDKQPLVLISLKYKNINMVQFNYESDLLRFVHLRRPRLKKTFATLTVTYPTTGFATPNFYNTLWEIPEEDKKFPTLQAEAETFSATANFIANEADLETKIPNLLKLMIAIADRGTENTNETFWGDVNSIMGQPPADYAAAASYTTNLSLLWDNVFAHLFLEDSPQLMQTLCNALVIFRLIKSNADDWNTPIAAFAKARILTPQWLFAIYAAKREDDDKPVNGDVPNNQGFQAAVRTIQAQTKALRDLYAAISFVNDEGQISKDKLEKETTFMLAGLGVPETDGYFPHQESLNAIQKQRSKDIDKNPKAVSNQHYTILVNGLLISGDAQPCITTPPLNNPCGQAPTVPFVPGSSYYTRRFMGDLMVTRQYLVKYELGEIAHNEPVMKNLKKVRTHRRLNRSEITEFLETESSTEEERENQTTERFSMEKETSNVVSQEMGIEAGVSVSGTFGPVSIESSVGFNFNTSSVQSTQEASSFSKEITSRALNKIKKSVRQSKTVTIIQETEETAEHTVDNAPNSFVATPTDHINGVYRWLDKIYLNKVFNYGERLFYEFMVPEPANFYLYQQYMIASGNLNDGEKVLKPIHPSQLTSANNALTALTSFKSISEGDYNMYAAYYGVTDISVPPPVYQVVSKSLKVSVVLPGTGSSNVWTEGVHVEEGLQIPEGYVAKKAFVRVRFGENHPILNGNYHYIQSGAGATVTVLIGKQEVKHAYAWGVVVPNQFPTIQFDAASNSKGLYVKDLNNNDNGAPFSTLEDEVFTAGGRSIIPITAKATMYGGTTSLDAIVNIEVRFNRLPSALEAWQMETYSAIMAGYQRQKSEYDEWMADQKFDSNGVQGNNPLINRQIEKEELKKRCIELFSGQRFESFDAAVNGLHNVSNYPEIHFDESRKEGLWVKYFEQVFDWSNMLYIFYPYFYGRKKNWLHIKALTNNDPIFEKFLQAGYARVVVPVRLGFEHYTIAGKQGYDCWINDNDPTLLPLENSTEILNILSEIMAGQDIDPEDLGHVPVGHYKHTVPTNIVYIVPETPPATNPLPDNSAEPEIAPYL